MRKLCSECLWYADKKCHCSPPRDIELTPGHRTWERPEVSPSDIACGMYAKEWVEREEDTWT